MNWKSIAPIVLSLLIAVSGSYFLYKYINKRKVPVQVVQVVEKEAVEVAVAAISIPWGTKLQEDMIKTAPYLKESLPTNYFNKSADLKGRVILSPLKPNEPITEDKLAPNSVTTGGVSAILSEGMRAISVKGDKVIGISGFINPGNRVDVIVTIQDPTINKVKSKIILENLLVLATGTQVQKNEKGEPMPVDVYTLEVSPEQAERLALAASQGRLNFALRNVIDSEDIRTRGTTIPELLATSRWQEIEKSPSDNDLVAKASQSNLSKKASTKIEKVSKKKKWRPRGSITVEIIKGTKINKKRFSL